MDFEEAGFYASIQLAVITIMSVVQIGVFMSVFAFLNYTDRFDIDIQLFIDEFLLPLFIAVLGISVMWHIFFTLTGR